MDNTKIFIDIDDELTFVVERILAAKTKNVIVVMPEKAAILSGLPTLRLLQRAVEETQKYVVLVTMDDVGKVLAAKAGFVVRNRVGEVEPDIWSTFMQAPPVPAAPVMPKPPVTSEPIVLNEEQITEEEHPPTEPLTPAVSDEETIQQEELKKGPEQKAVQEEAAISEEGASIRDVAAINPPVYAITDIPAPIESTSEEVIAPQKQEVSQKPKYVQSVKIVHLDGFDLVIGGDAAVIKKSRELDRKVISKKAQTISSFHDDPVADADGLIGTDIEANVSKKKLN